MTATDESFAELPLPRKELAPEIMHRYRVYSEPAKFILVEAPSALEAIKKSSMPDVLRVERDSIDHYPVLDMQTMSEVLANHNKAASSLQAPAEQPPA